MTAVRGTSNGNSNGGAPARAARRAWLVLTYRADVDVRVGVLGGIIRVPVGEGLPAARCYRCGLLLLDVTAWAKTRPGIAESVLSVIMRRHVTVDRIIPGKHGGTYRRNNIRPACGDCNSETGGKLRAVTA